MKQIEITMRLLFSALVLYPAVTFGHGDIKHESELTETEKEPSIKAAQIDQNVLAYKVINSEYIKNIKPIFEKKCFDCHGDATSFPWYYKLPGVKQMIDGDIKEAKKHVDMSWDFPFLSHETPLNDLKSFKKIALEGGMPPLRYVLGHWDANLNETEKAKMVEWTTQSIKLLEGGEDE